MVKMGHKNLYLGKLSYKNLCLGKLVIIPYIGYIDLLIIESLFKGKLDIPVHKKKS